MNRIAPSRIGVHAFFVVLGLCPFPSLALARLYTAPAGGVGIMPITLPAINVNSPADLGGASHFTSALPRIELGAGLTLPSAPQTALPAARGYFTVTAAPNEIQAVQSQLAKFAAQISNNNPQGQAPSASQIQQSSGHAYDGSSNKAQAGSVEAGPIDGGGSNGANGGGGNGGDGSNGGGSNGGGDRRGSNGTGDPRVVMIIDTLEGPASETLVARIEKLADLGVRVVFVTARPDKGPNSADEVLMSKLRVRVNNPVIAVTSNGARVTAKSSRAENPRPLIEDQEGFPAPVVENFRKINVELQKVLNVGEVRELGTAGAEAPHVYGVELPEGADLAKAASLYNAKLRRLGYQYKVEGRRDEAGRQFLFTQSTALRLNVGRIFRGLFSQYPNLRDDLRREEVTVLVDSARSPKFVKALREDDAIPGRGFHMPTVKNAAELESALGGILGVEALKKEHVTRYQLRTYIERKEQIQRWGKARENGSGGGGGGGRSMQPRAYGKLYRQMAFYRGIIMYDLMGRIYKTLRKGQYFDASPEAAQETLEKMWNFPLTNGVRLSPELAEARSNPVWRALSKGYLETAKVWLSNYYKRNFPGDWPSGVNQRVIGTLINLAQDGKNQIKVEYTSPVARYEISMMPARTNVYRGADGHWVLEGHVYRTGQEPYQEEFEESVEKNLLAHAMLQGYGDPKNGKWYVNGEADPRIRIVFHYMTRDLDGTMTPEQVGQDSANITTLISEMLADEEFMTFWREQEAENAKVASKAAHAAELRAAKAKSKRDARSVKRSTRTAARKKKTAK